MLFIMGCETQTQTNKYSQTENFNVFCIFCVLLCEDNVWIKCSDLNFGLTLGGLSITLKSSLFTKQNSQSSSLTHSSQFIHQQQQQQQRRMLRSRVCFFFFYKNDFCCLFFFRCILQQEDFLLMKINLKNF